MTDAAERLANCLDVVAAEPSGISAVELGRALDLSRASASRLLSALERAGLLDKNQESRKYEIGVNLFLLGSASLAVRRLTEVATLPLAKAVSTTGVTLTIGVNRGRNTIFLSRAERIEGMVVITTQSAPRYPCHVTAVGKAILAFGPETSLTSYISAGLTKLTEHTLTDGQALLLDLQASRDRGYAVTNGEHRADGRGVAVPILGRKGEVVGAVGAPSTPEAFGDDFLALHVPILREVASSISRFLGHGGAPNLHVA